MEFVMKSALETVGVCVITEYQPLFKSISVQLQSYIHILPDFCISSLLCLDSQHVTEIHNSLNLRLPLQ